MPGIIPRIRELVRRAFGHIPYLMALIYNLVRLIPDHHPYLKSRNIGHFTLRMVIAEAANNLVINRKNIDQIVVFVMLLVAIVIMFAQVALMAYAAMFQPAMATSYFATPRPTTAPTSDVAFMLLDHVFGVPNLFCAGINSTDCTAVLSGGRMPFHIALHNLFRFYSMGLLIVGTVIFLYYMVVVVAETAVSGTPFGSRFQHIWVPIRLVMALGLLIPINYGLNSGQYLVLFSAKFGSSFATNAWLSFNSTIALEAPVFPGRIGANPSGERRTLLAKPIAQDLSSLVQFMSIVRSCRYAYWKHSDNPNDRNNPPSPVIPTAFAKVRAYFVKTPDVRINPNANARMLVDATTTFQQAVDFYGPGSNIVIVFGEIVGAAGGAGAASASTNYMGDVKPWCGSVRVNISSYQSPTATQNAATRMQERYFNLVKALWIGSGGPAFTLRRLADRHVEIYNDNEAQPNLWQCDPLTNSANILPPACERQTDGSGARQSLIDTINSQITADVRMFWQNYNTNGLDITVTNQIKDRGWGGAGIWYNTIAELNGAFIDAVMNVPSSVKYPLVMEQVRERNMKDKSNATMSPFDIYTPRMGNDTTMPLDGPNADRIAEILNAAYKAWNQDGTNQSSTDKVSTGSEVRNMINILFGTSGLFSMRGDNASIHPMAQLTSLGKSLVNSAVLSISGSIVGGGLGPLFQGMVGTFAGFASGLLSNIAMLGLTAGIVLFYVLPFLPFLYFYFAVGTWIMSIFEAMVGAPLWALAHLKIDGEGLPGDGARDGYFLILEIFLRPILSVFGLVAAMIIFAAQARVLNVIWGLVLGNLTGVASPIAPIDAVDGSGVMIGMDVPRDSIDQFFYTMLYAAIVYMLAIASFKLIDRIPDNILRWMGSSSSTYSDINPDATEGLTRYASTGGLMIGQQITGALSTAAQKTGATAGAISTAAEKSGGALAKAITPGP